METKFCSSQNTFSDFVFTCYPQITVSDFAFIIFYNKNA
jgi:hypothetical protein